MALMTVDGAMANLLAKTKVLGSETVALERAGGRTLARPIYARLTQPPFRSSAMDGYALKAKSTLAAGMTFKIVGEAAAGHRYTGTINKDEAVRIFTGAPVPDDGDTVIIQENIKVLDGETIEITRNIEPDQNIRPAGGDFTQDQPLLASGHILTPAALALIAASGHAEVEVIRKPRVGVLATGDELVPAGTIPADSQIVASNSYALNEIIRLNGGEVVDFGIVPDDKTAIHAAIAAARSQKVDILVSSGGVSVGDYDLVQTVMKEAGMALEFWKVAMRPGKPLMFGTLPGDHEILVLGLPGNPVSSIVSANLFLVAMMAKMSGRQTEQPLYDAILTKPLKANGPRRHYIRALMQPSAEGIMQVTPALSADSSLLNILAQSNCLIMQEVDSPALPEGASCKILLPRYGL